MDSKMYLDEKVRQAHYQELLREAEKQRLLAQLPRHRWSTIKRVAGSMGVLLLKLGTRLKEFEQSPTFLENHP
jgi:hypothetical protein